MKRCPKCGHEKPLSEFHRNRARRDGYGSYCKLCANAATTRWVQKDPAVRAAAAAAWAQALKREVIEAYGGACDCCGEREPIFLTLDHRDGIIPAAHRYPNGGRVKGASLYARVKREGFPDAYRVLCWNCNAAHGLFGFCPHERRLKAAS